MSKAVILDIHPYDCAFLIPATNDKISCFDMGGVPTTESQCDSVNCLKPFTIMSTTLHQSITERLVYYSVLFQKSAYVVRVIPNWKELLMEAIGQWRTGPTAYLPPAGDQAKRAEFIAICDEICSSQPTNPLEYVFFFFHCKPLSGGRKLMPFQCLQCYAPCKCCDATNH